jgi:hypothetical protein
MSETDPANSNITTSTGFQSRLIINITTSDNYLRSIFSADGLRNNCSAAQTVRNVYS